MKQLRKLSRTHLKQMSGGAVPPISHCNGCPTGAFGPHDSFSCDAYWALSEFCRNCVLVNTECFVPITIDF